ncbi:MAG: AI-2E family transporter [Actinomycetota bacterium]|nr:AI-2E family transporter [Actinomycetota bacterium]
MSTKKLVISTYLQYIFLVLGALLLFVFVCQLGGVLLAFLLAAILAFVLNPLVRLLERWRVPRAIAVTEVFARLTASVTAALLVLIIPAVGRVQVPVQNPQVLTDWVTRLSNWAHDLRYVGKQVAAINQAPLEQFVQSTTPSAGQVFNAVLGLIGGTFGVFGALLNLLLMLITSIYVLLARERITDAMLRTVPATVRGQTIGPFLTPAMSALYGVIGAVFAVPIAAAASHPICTKRSSSKVAPRPPLRRSSSRGEYAVSMEAPGERASLQSTAKREG